MNRYKYGPYGETSGLSGTTHGYTGQRYDSETGLYYFRMRHYSPQLGRFLQPDPLGYAAGTNMYSFATNAPLNALDALGLKADTAYGSIYEALREFAKETADTKNLVDGVEDHAKLYSRETCYAGGSKKTTYYYTTIKQGNTNSSGADVSSAGIPNGAQFLGVVHNHGGSDAIKSNQSERNDYQYLLANGYNIDEEYSSEDVQSAFTLQQKNANLYLIGISGQPYMMNKIDQAKLSAAEQATRSVKYYGAQGLPAADEMFGTNVFDFFKSVKQWKTPVTPATKLGYNADTVACEWKGGKVGG